jgi:hypothetical protein
MLTRLSRGLRVSVAALAPACLVALPLSADSHPAAQSLPTRLSDQEFWRLSADLSEQDGTFRSDNLVSNELWLQHVIPDLVKTVEPGHVYVGVGPEQNFTYIAALKPAMAFIIDIRRGNLDLQLMYKALFEISADRLEFVSRLFSRKQPEGLSEQSTAAEIFDAFKHVDPSQTLHDETLDAIRRQVVGKHRFVLSDSDWSGIEYALDAFTTFGSRINYLSTGTDSYGGSPLPSYADLMTATDADGVAHSYLNTEDSFRFIKDLESRNLVVPVVGDFVGPKAIRAVGSYLSRRWSAERAADAQGRLLIHADRLLEGIPFDVLHQGEMERDKRQDPALRSGLRHLVVHLPVLVAHRRRCRP